MSRTALRICPLCEATCGLVLTVSQEAGTERVTGARGDYTERVTGARGDRDDVFSHGYLCPKGASFAELDNDPDRLRAPLIRRDGELVECGWDEALAAAVAGLQRVQADADAAVGVYLGNPNAHTVAGGLYVPPLVRSLKTRNVFSASTLDQMPKQVACGYLFGNAFAFTVPDVDRTDHLVVIGANPLVSNGSIATAADFGGKLKALKRRGGRLTVIDPNRTRTAAMADRHLAPRPGTDGALLFAVVNVLFDEDLVDPELGGLAPHVSGVEQVRAAALDFPPEAVAGYCGVSPDEIRILARDIAAGPTAVYGRIGTSTVRFGTLTSWLVDVVNLLTGNLDRPGGAMFTTSPISAAPRPARPGRGFSVGRWNSRVSGYPEICSELPAALLPEEIETSGGGQIRGLVTIAGNPVLSAPDGDRLSAALAGLEFMVSIDPYLNETTRHADVILPPPPPSQAPHFDIALSGVAVRNNARYSPPVIPLPDGRPGEVEILCRLTLGLLGLGTDADPNLVDAQIISTVLGKEVADPSSAVAGRDVDELTAMLHQGPGYERRLDMMLRLGPFGDGFGATTDGLTLQRLKDNPHGVDLGPLTPRIPEILRTPSGRIELAPEPILADIPRLQGALDEPQDGLLLIGRRHLRSNNSWMHNLPALAGGTNRCTLLIHPDDAARLGVTDTAVVTGPAGKLEVPVEITDAIRPGVVSLPHGWGHTAPGTRMAVAAGQAGVNVNSLLDDSLIEPLSGTAVLNGVPVTVQAAG